MWEGNPEIVLNEQTGIVIPNDDQKALIDACLSLLENKTQCKKYGKSDRQRFSQHFTAKKMISQFEDLYKRGT